nr:GspE/PulE family protein [Allomuricauda sp.]
MNLTYTHFDLKTDFIIAPDLTKHVTAEQAFHYRIVPKGQNNGSLCLMTDNVPSPELEAELFLILDTPVAFEETESETLQNYLTANYRIGKQADSHELRFTQDFLENILLTAKELDSSDIHFEPYENHCRIRFRLDGKLVEHFQIPSQDYPTIVNKIKIRASLDIAEKRLPQDGRITVKTTNEEFDIRVSCLPTLFGEKIVLRILKRNTQGLSLEALGLNKREFYLYKEAIKIPNGIILISGPTGSGKTTTLYATLKLLNDEKTNILTIEDPIEYTLEGINQVQLKENIGLDFPSALRTFLRQDPDIIMVGEIRDVKTANMAIRAALTGHLVLSTIHTNSAWATVSRLIDMGIPPFLIASTLNLSVAQRLVRKLCPNCKKKQEISPQLFPENFDIPKKLSHHFVAVGCPKCYHTGYQGRKAIYEVIPITKELSVEIKNNILEVDSYLKENKITTLRENAIRMVLEGDTSIEEVYALLTN